MSLHICLSAHISSYLSVCPFFISSYMSLCSCLFTFVSIFMPVHTCLRISAPICLYVYSYPSLSVCMSVLNQFIYISLFLSVHNCLYFHVCSYLSVHISSYLSVCLLLSVHTCLYMSVCLFFICSYMFLCSNQFTPVSLFISVHIIQYVHICSYLPLLISSCMSLCICLVISVHSNLPVCLRKYQFVKNICKHCL